MTPIFPQRLYFAARDFGKDGFGMCADLTEDLDAAIDAALPGYGDELKPFRIFCIEFCTDTNLPERTTDVTEDAIRERNEWLATQGISPIAA